MGPAAAARADRRSSRAPWRSGMSAGVTTGGVAESVTPLDTPPGLDPVMPVSSVRPVSSVITCVKSTPVERSRRIAHRIEVKPHRPFAQRGEHTRQRERKRDRFPRASTPRHDLRPDIRTRAAGSSDGVASSPPLTSFFFGYRLSGVTSMSGGFGSIFTSSATSRNACSPKLCGGNSTITCALAAARCNCAGRPCSVKPEKIRSKTSRSSGRRTEIRGGTAIVCDPSLS